MSAGKPWPLGLRSEAGQPDGEFGGLALDLAMIESQRDGWWRVQELDRHDGTESVVPTLAELARITGETCDRLGYGFARSFVAAVLRDEAVDDEHAALITNAQHRWGRRGLILFAFFLEVHAAADEQWRRRSSS